MPFINLSKKIHYGNEGLIPHSYNVETLTIKFEHIKRMLCQKNRHKHPFFMFELFIQIFGQQLKSNYKPEFISHL